MSKSIQFYVSDKEIERIVKNLANDIDVHKITITIDKSLTINDMDLLDSTKLYIVKGEDDYENKNESTK